MQFNLSQELVLPYLLGDTGRERCALIYGPPVVEGGGIRAVSVLEVPNRHDDPENNFRIAMADVRHRRRGYEVIGVLHTHPGKCSPDPSANDLNGLAHDGQYGVIVHLRTSSVVLFDRLGVIDTIPVLSLPRYSTAGYTVARAHVPA